MSEKYIPLYKVSGKAMNMIADIAAAVERYRILLEGPDGVRLRKINHVRTIRGTTAIEGNTLTEDQITAILSGKRVVGSKREIDEIKGAHEAYEAIESFNPYSIDDMLKAHGLLTKGLVDRLGKFRNCNVGVMDGFGNVVHMAPPFANVPTLVKDLFEWLADSEDPVLIKSCVFHYEFEFIHPFIDGNGRMGRLWQSLILGKLHPLFEHLPVENMVYSNQQNYYDAITASTNAGQSGPFIDFMLNEIYLTLKSHQGEPLHDKLHDKLHDNFPQLSEKAFEILEIIWANPTFNAEKIGERVSLSQRQVKTYINALKLAGLIVRVGSNKTGYWKVNIE
jgi:Fic family protein